MPGERVRVDPFGIATIGYPAPHSYSRRGSSSLRLFNQQHDLRLSRVEYQRRMTSKKAWNRIERRVDQRARALGSRRELARNLENHLDEAYDKAMRMEERAYQVMAFPFGQDIADQLATAMYQLADNMKFAYTGYLEGIWQNAMGDFNHGQIAITFEAYWEEIQAHSEYAEEHWPGEDVEPWNYVNDISFAFDFDVWMRAFTDTTDEPVARMQECLDTARAIIDMADSVGTALTVFDLVGAAMATEIPGGFNAPRPRAKAFMYR